MHKKLPTTVAGLWFALCLLPWSNPVFGDEPITDMWRFQSEVKEGERVLSHSVTLFRKGGVFEGTTGKRCSISEGRENEVPLQKVDTDLTTRKVSFFGYWDSAENEDGTPKAAYDMKFEGSIGDKNVEGVITYITTDPCLRPVEDKVTLTRIDTGVKSDLVKEVASPTANVKGRYDIRLFGRPSVNDLNGQKTSVGGRGFAFVGGSKANFQSLATPSQLEIDITGKGFDGFKPCHPVARQGTTEQNNVIQIIGDGKFETKATKNPKNPIGIFHLKTVSRCREIPGNKSAFK